ENAGIPTAEITFRTACAADAIRLASEQFPNMLVGAGTVVNAEQARAAVAAGAKFMPMVGSIPFVGYIFKLEDGADVEAFKTTLKDNANLRWNICTAAEEMIVESKDNTVFFLMCPSTFEQETPAE
ncbi:MAG: hypothetical protein J6S59_08230, partial [Clostridia bacterium]|nr:hypothetical protein [Clostridia bacterium]